MEVLHQEGTDTNYALWDATGCRRDYSPPAWSSRATTEQKREGWEIAVRIEKIVASVLDEAHRRQVEESGTRYEGPEGLYERPPYRPEILEPI